MGAVIAWEAVLAKTMAMEGEAAPRVEMGFPETRDREWEMIAVTLEATRGVMIGVGSAGAKVSVMLPAATRTSDRGVSTDCGSHRFRRASMELR